MDLFAPIPLKGSRQCLNDAMAPQQSPATHARKRKDECNYKKPLFVLVCLHDHAHGPSFFSCTSRRLLDRASDGNSSSMRG